MPATVKLAVKLIMSVAAQTSESNETEEARINENEQICKYICNLLALKSAGQDGESVHLAGEKVCVLCIP